MSDTVRQPQAESAQVMSEIIAGVEVPETAAVAESTRLLQETISPLPLPPLAQGFPLRPDPRSPARRETGSRTGSTWPPCSTTPAW